MISVAFADRDGAPKGPLVKPRHDAAVRQEALRLAVDVHTKMLGALVSGSGDGYRQINVDGGAGDAAVLDTAEKFRVFLTVAGQTDSYMIQAPGGIRAVFSPGSSVALGLPPIVDKIEQAPAQRGSLIAELRELLLFAQWLVEQEKAAGKAESDPENELRAIFGEPPLPPEKSQ